MTSKDEAGWSSGGPMERGMDLAKRMMAQMDAGSPSPIAMTQKMMKAMRHEGRCPQPMMQMCMGMCAEHKSAPSLTRRTICKSLRRDTDRRCDPAPMHTRLLWGPERRQRTPASRRPRPRRPGQVIIECST